MRSYSVATLLFGHVFLMRTVHGSREHGRMEEGKERRRSKKGKVEKGKERRWKEGGREERMEGGERKEEVVEGGRKGRKDGGERRGDTLWQLLGEGKVQKGYVA